MDGNLLKYLHVFFFNETVSVMFLFIKYITQYRICIEVYRINHQVYTCRCKL